MYPWHKQQTKEKTMTDNPQKISALVNEPARLGLEPKVEEFNMEMKVEHDEYETTTVACGQDGLDITVDDGLCNSLSLSHADFDRIVIAVEKYRKVADHGGIKIA